MTNDIVDQWIDIIDEWRPTVIEAYVDAARELADRILETGRKVHSPRGIITSAGVLTEETRKAVTQALGSTVLNRYGSREVANVACSCHLSTDLHVNEPWCYLEIVRDDGSPCVEGEEGNILVTVYSNRTMPLIRYRIEDRGIWGSSESCGCGRTTRRLAAVSGRTSDYLVAADATRINGTALTTLLYSVTGIQRFQYRQDVSGKVTLAAIPGAGCSAPALEAELRKPADDLRKMLKGREVEVAIVGEILPSKSGKYRYIINELASSSGRSESIGLR